MKDIEHLLSVMEFAKITESMSSLRSGKTKVCDNPNDPSEVNSTEVIWTNETQWKTVEAKWVSFYAKNVTRNVSYVKDFRVGIIAAKTSFIHIFNEGN